MKVADGLQRIEGQGQSNTTMLTVIRFSSNRKVILPDSQPHHALKTDLEASQAIKPLRSSRP